MKSGALVPDEMGSRILKERLEQNDARTKGWIGDGWCRERKNSTTLLGFGLDLCPSLVITLTVSEATLLKRLGGRRQDPVTKEIYHTEYKMPTDPEVRARLIQRKDDQPESIQSRLATFEKQKDEALGPFRECGIPIKEIDGEGAPDQVFQRITRAWDLHFSLQSPASGVAEAKNVRFFAANLAAALLLADGCLALAEVGKLKCPFTRTTTGLAMLPGVMVLNRVPYAGLVGLIYSAHGFLFRPSTIMDQVKASPWSVVAAGCCAFLAVTKPGRFI